MFFTHLLQKKVTSVAEGGQGSERGITSGCVVVAVNQESVKSLQDIKTVMSSRKKKGFPDMLLTYRDPKRGARAAAKVTKKREI
jgi:hypothetical protein